MLNKYYNFKSIYGIVSSLDLVNKIKNVNLPTKCKLISFDVINLFPSIPPNEANILIENHLKSNKTNPTVTLEITRITRITKIKNSFDSKLLYFPRYNLHHW